MALCHFVVTDVASLHPYSFQLRDNCGDFVCSPERVDVERYKDVRHIGVAISVDELSYCSRVDD